MPIQPTLTAAQQLAVQGQANLASSSVVSMGNQMTVLDGSIQTLSDARDGFQTRYDFWDQYTNYYFVEKRHLNGSYQTSPIIPSDYTDFLARTGRLYLSSSNDPQRIAEFDGGGATSSDPSNEITFIANEFTTRNRLTNGFTSSAFPVGAFNSTPVTSGTTVMTVRNSGQTQMVIPTGGQAILEDAGAACWMNIISVVENFISGNYTYTVTIAVNTTGFGTVNANGTFLTSFSGFTNTERTSNITTVPRYQAIYDGWVLLYKAAVSDWQVSMSQQLAAIASNTAEDAPDTAYISALTSASNALIAYLAPVTIDVSNAGLAPNIALVATRNTDIPIRLAYIPSRLTATLTYDHRYKYSKYLYNLLDGQIPMLTTLQNQKAQLALQQTASNARAANLLAEL